MNNVSLYLDFQKIKKDLKKYCLSKIGEEELDSLGIIDDKESLLKSLDILDKFIKHIIDYSFTPWVIQDIRLLIDKTEKEGILHLEEVVKIREFIKSINGLKSYLTGSRFEDIKDIGLQIPDFSQVLQRIKQVLDEEGNIRDNATPELYEIREDMRKIKNSINVTLKTIVNNPEFTPFLQDKFVSLKNERWTIPVKASFKNQIKGFIIDISNTGETVFIEPYIIVEKNTKYKEKIIEEKKEIDRILKKISNAFKNKTEDFKVCFNILKIIDFNIAKARYSIEKNLKKPIITNYWEIRKAKHPFIENPIPIDIELGKEFDILIITGPNTGGKTAALRTIGLLTLMANSGLFIPAEEDSKIAHVDNILIDIGDEQSLSQNLSTFSSHIKRINLILKKATQRSLVLIDEIGAGTDPNDGANLGVAIIEYLYERKVNAVITSHFEKVKNIAFFKERIENATVDFDIKSLTPRYKIIIGVTGKSMGIEIASRLNLPKEIIDRAIELAMPTNRDYEVKDVIEKLNSQIKMYEGKKKYYESLLSELMKKEKELNKKEKELNEVIEKIKSREKLEFLEFLKDKREAILDKLKKIEEKDREELREILKEVEKTYRDIKEKDKKERAVETVKDVEVNIGDRVIVNGIGEADVIEIGKSGIITVKSGVIKIKVEKKDILEVIKDQRIESFNFRVNADFKTSFELNIIGKKRDEAIREIERYIESIIINGGTEGIIIHGKGKGILKDAVIEILNKYNIKNYVQSPDGGATKFILNHS